MPNYYDLAKCLGKSGLHYEFIIESFYVELWFYYADYINSVQYERYLQNPPIDERSNKTIAYNNDVYYITSSNE